MSGSANKVVCPHCGAENARSEIVTLCYRCFKSLKETPAPAQPPVEEAIEPRAEPPEEWALAPPTVPEAPAPEPPRDWAFVPPPPPPPPLAIPSVARPAAPAVPVPAPPPVVSAPAPPPPSGPVPARAVTPPPASPAVGPAFPAEVKEAFQRELRRMGTRVTGGDTRGWVPAIIALVVGFFFLFMLVGGHFMLTLVIGAVAAAAVVLGRAWLAASFYDAIVDPAPAFVRLGQSFTWGLTVRARKPVNLRHARMVLRCEERAVSGSGKQTQHHRHTVFEQPHVVLSEPLLPGQSATLRATFTMPETALPSLPGRSNRVEWTVSLEAPVPGYCPDIRDSARLQVVPVMEQSEPRLLDSDRSVPVAWLERAPAMVGQGAEGEVAARLAPAAGGSPDAAPVVPAGATRDFRVQVWSQRDIDCDNIRCTVGYRLYGRGNEEQIWLPGEYTMHQGDLVAGQVVDYQLTITVPAGGPVSFRGTLVNCEWLVRVHLATAIWSRRKDIYVPFLVTPQLVAPGGQASA